MDCKLLNGANLAFIGDAYYELYIREYLLKKNITNQKQLHETCVKYVSASGHQKIMQYIEKYLTEEEILIYKRGRNHKYNISRKNLNIGQYLTSSGFEALIGYLHLKQENARLEEILHMAIHVIEEGMYE